MNSKIYLWYNGVLCEYNYGTDIEYEKLKLQYPEDKIDVLCTLDTHQINVCKKITNKLNYAVVDAK